MPSLVREAEPGALLHRLPVMVASVDTGERYRYVNDVYASRLGQTPEAIIGREIRDVCRGVYSQIAPHVRAALRGEPQDFEIKLALPDAAPCWMQATYLPDVEHEQVTGFTIFVTEIDERKRAQQSHAQFKYACDQGMEGFALHDVAGHFTYCNPAQARMYGFSPEEVVGKSWQLFYGPEQIRKIEEVHFPQLMREGSWRGELIGQRKSGESFDVEVSLKLLVDEVGDPSGLVCNCRDITERKVSESSLRQLQKIEALGQLTGGVAHDFNNLLAVIVGNLELLRELHSGDSNADALLADAMKAATSGAALTNRLLAFARKQDLNPTSIDLAELLTEMRDLLQPSLGERYTVELSVEPNLAPCRADRSELQNAVFNLAFNARDAMPDGGAIRLRAHRPEQDPDRFVSIVVEDSGVGMDEHIQANMFDPFFTTKPEGKGNGLGLSMVHGYVVQSGGCIEVTSAPDEGTVVTLIFPLAQTEQTIAHAASTDAHEIGAGETVLLVEDRDEVLHVVSSMLERLNYSVLPASDAEQARRILDSERSIDIVLSDVILPGSENGVDVVRYAGDARPGIRGVLMSGYSPEEVGGANAIPKITKPITLRALGSALKAVMSESPNLS